MAHAPYVLARTFQEAHGFARTELGLSHGQYRVITSAGTLKSIRGADLHLVPGWRRRFDGFTMKSALRWTRMNVIDHESDEAEAPVEPVPDGLNPPGTQPQITEGADPALMAAFEAFLETGNGDQMISEGSPLPPELVTALEDEITSPEQVDAEIEAAKQAEAPAEPEVKQRRRRCKECGVLVDPSEVETHAAEHLPTED